MPDRPIPRPDPDDASRRRAIRSIVVGLLALLAVIVFGAAGYVAMGWPVGDALYMVVITISTVGFGDVRPIDTTALRLHTSAVIALGLVATGYTVGGFLRLVTEEEFRRLVGHHRVRRTIDTLDGHIIVVGLGRMGQLVAEELAHGGHRFVVIDLSAEKVAEAEARGWLFVQGDATEEDVLERAGVDRARSLVAAMPNDAANVFITLTARQRNPKLGIVARAERATTQKKLRQAGANQVVLPAAIGAHRIVSILTNPSAVEFIELVTHRSSLAIEMDEVAVTASGPFSGRSLRDADVGRKTGVIVMAIKRADGRVEFPPSGDTPFAPGDSIVLLGRRANLDQFRKEFRG